MSRHEIKPVAADEVQVAGSVARAVSLFLCGRFKPPRLTMIGPFVRMSLVRAQGDDERIGDDMAEADLLAQVYTSPKAPKITHASIAKAAVNAEILRPLIRRLTHMLLKYGVVSGLDFSRIAKGPDRDFQYNSPRNN